VDYERGNFSVSQCVWQDGAPEQISAILSPTYADKAKSSTAVSKSSRVGLIVGVTIAAIAALALAAGLGYYLSQRRKRPTSKSPTEDVQLTNVDNKDNKADYPPEDPNSPFPPYKKLDSSSSVHREQHPDGELGTQGEIYQMPTTENGEGDYFDAAIKLASERRAASTPQIDGRLVAYELPGCEPAPAEMDDERSRAGLSPMLNPATPVTRGSSRASSVVGPVSDTL
jgi:hypothetical protein